MNELTARDAQRRVATINRFIRWADGNADEGVTFGTRKSGTFEPDDFRTLADTLKAVSLPTMEKATTFGQWHALGRCPLRCDAPAPDDGDWAIADTDTVFGPTNPGEKPTFCRWEATWERPKVGA